MARSEESVPLGEEVLGRSPYDFLLSGRVNYQLDHSVSANLSDREMGALIVKAERFVELFFSFSV